MGRVSAAVELEGTVHDAERCWYDTGRWPAWVEGLQAVEHVSPGWPEVGAEVRWRSGPAGRGEVRERVAAHEPLGGQTVAVQDASIDGEQIVRFVPAGEGRVTVELALEYAIRDRNPLTPIVDRLFIRPAMRRSLQGTLHRFGAILGQARAPAGEP